VGDIGKDSFEEFIKGSLENYAGNDTPDWTEMESRLDEAGSGSGSGAISSTLLKWIAAIVVVSGVSMFVADLMSNEESDKSVQNNSSQDSFMSRIRALTIADEGEKPNEAIQVKGEERGDETGVKQRRGNTDSQNYGSQGDNTSEASDEDPIVFTKPVKEVRVFEPSGDTYDMLRAQYKDKSIPDPVAAFSDDIKEEFGCVPLKVSFRMESQDVAMKYFWDFGDGTFSSDPNPVHVFTETGTYSVELTVTSLINQKYITTVSSDPIVVFGRPEVAFSLASDVNVAGNEVAFSDLSSNVIEWEWDFGDLSTSYEENPTHRYDEEGTYVVELVGTDPNGCKDTSTSMIRISGEKMTDDILAANAFTPNGDGQNDEWNIKINGSNTLEFELTVYDRRGMVVFETDDFNQKWDGRLRGAGRIAPQGSYFWIATFRNQTDQHERLQGTITLMK